MVNLNIFVDMVTMVVDYRFALTGIVRAFSGDEKNYFYFHTRLIHKKRFISTSRRRSEDFIIIKKKIQSRKGMQ